jgi:hypothetical protein
MWVQYSLDHKMLLASTISIVFYALYTFSAKRIKDPGSKQVIHKYAILG